MWDKCKDLLLFYGYLFFISKAMKEVRFSIKVICIFCAIRIIWDVFAIKDYILASEYRVIDILLILLLAVVALVWLYPIFNGTKRSTSMVPKGNARL